MRLPRHNLYGWCHCAMSLSQRHLPHDAEVGAAEALLHAASLKLSTLEPQTVVNTDINLWPEEM